MPRSLPSRADQDLLSALQARGVTCSSYQLERWRQHGLLSRASLSYPGGGGSAASLDAQTLEAAEILATTSRRGRPWQLLGLMLLQNGYMVEDVVLRIAFNWLLEVEDRALRSTVSRASERLASASDALDKAEAITEFVRGSRAERQYFRLTKPVMRERDPQLGRKDTYALMRAAMVWNVAERLGEPLDGEDLKARAQGLAEGPPMAVPRVTFADRCITAASLTQDEVGAVWHIFMASDSPEARHVNAAEAPTNIFAALILRSLTQIRVSWNGDPGIRLKPDHIAHVLDGVDTRQQDLVIHEPRCAD